MFERLTDREHKSRKATRHEEEEYAPTHYYSASKIPQYRDVAQAEQYFNKVKSLAGLRSSGLSSGYGSRIKLPPMSTPYKLPPNSRKKKTR